MPLIDLTAPAGALPEQARASLVDRLTAALIRHEGAPDNARTRAMTWVFLHELPTGAVHVAGAAAPTPVYRLQVTVPAGTLLDGPGPVGTSGRSALVRELTDLVLEAEGCAATAADRGRVYCVISEVEDGYWGALGTTVRMSDIASIAAGEDETPVAGLAREALDELLTRAGSANP